MADYAQIVLIEARDSAAQGDLVSIAVQVKNLADYGFYVSLTGDRNGSGITFSPGYSGIDGGAIFTFYGSFFMPNQNVTITVTSWWWGEDNAWHQDETKTKTVTLATLTPLVSEFKITDFNKV
jgi:hypothetical protein